MVGTTTLLRAVLWTTALLASAAPVVPPSLAADAGVVSGEYRLPAKVDPDVAPGVVTELWARVYRPRSLAGAPFPLVVFLHGNHATCGRFDAGLGVRVDDDVTYTFTGRCPSGYVVTPSHEGYAYLAEPLAKAGHVVVSINANRGVNAADGTGGDIGLNLRRGRLVLRHLDLLARWSREGGAPGSLGFDPRGRLDLGRIGLVGHSRGGEGMRAALAQFRDRDSPWPGRIGSGARFRALYEIGPVDGQTGRTLDAPGLAWNVLLPYCDGDVASLEGVRPFDRMLLRPRDGGKAPKSTFAVYGANHNFYNTEWQQSDSPGCAGHAALFPELKGSSRQRATAVGSLVPFLRAHVGGDPASSAALFDPLDDLPGPIAAVTRVDRGFTDTPDGSVELRVEDFDRPTGTSSAGEANVARGIEVEHRRPVDHDAAQRAAAVSWSAAGSQHYLQTNWTPPGSGRDVDAYRTLEFRVSRQCDDLCGGPAPLNPGPTTDFSVRLVRADGSTSTAVRLSDHLELRGPVGYGDDGFAVLHPILATARIPLAAFGLEGAAVRGVRFTFDRTPTGAVYLANVRLSKRGAPPAMAAAAAAEPDGDTAATRRSGVAAPGTASIAAIRRTLVPSSGDGARGGGSAVEVEILADRPFPVTDALPVLLIGRERATSSRFAGGRTDRIVFILPEAAFVALEDDAAAELRLGVARRYDLGRFRRAMLR